MFVTPFRDWLDEQERKGRPGVLILEWLSVFALALPFWLVLFLEFGRSAWSVAAALAVSSAYASASLYARLLKHETCTHCKAPLALTRQVIGRRRLHEMEKCLEIERGGEEWYGHYIDLYSRRYRVELVQYRCRRCGAVWQQRTEEPACDYTLVRTIEVKD